MDPQHGSLVMISLEWMFVFTSMAAKSSRREQKRPAFDISYISIDDTILQAVGTFLEAD
jgi:hypothetical protein